MEEFNLRDGVLVKYSGTGADVTIPDGVTEIGRFAFRNCANLTSIRIPDGVTRIGTSAFEGCTGLISIRIPDSVTEIGLSALNGCVSLTSVTIPEGVTEIEDSAFAGCTNLASVSIPDGVTRIGRHAFAETAFSNHAANRDNGVLYAGKHLIEANDSIGPAYSIRQGTLTIGDFAFADRFGLRTIVIPDGVTAIGAMAFSGCFHLASVAVPDSVTRIGAGAFLNTPYDRNKNNREDGVLYIGRHLIAADKDVSGAYSVRQGTLCIGDGAFSGCKGLTSVFIPGSVRTVGSTAFRGCADLISATIPAGATVIGACAFEGCASLVSAVIPDGVRKIGFAAFKGCKSLTMIPIPDSVTEIGDDAFGDCSAATVVCGEGTAAHRYCVENRLFYLFDYQVEAFGGVLPPGLEKLASPFLADEERPFVFISYSHKDRDAVLGVIKTLYEAGWRIWYDEGLTIGDRYDETLEAHVKNCAAFLLFDTAHARGSRYIREREIPWAIAYGRPIVTCALEEGPGMELPDGAAAASVSLSGLETALAGVHGLMKGARRTAKGITVAFDPANREGTDAAAGNGFAYCLYAGASAAKAKAILLEARASGCNLYDAVESGEDAALLRESACLLVFLDRAFSADAHLTEILSREFAAGRDVAVCKLGDVKEDDLPETLRALPKTQMLSFVHGMTQDTYMHLSRYLQKRGCRDTSVLPWFAYKKTEKGIVITGYRGFDPAPVIERAYGGIPVIGIADRAFENRMHLKSLTIPDSVTEIGSAAFRGCANVTSFRIPDGVTSIKSSLLEGCAGLASFRIPDGVTSIGSCAFRGCINLTSIRIPDGTTEIPSAAFQDCANLTSIRIPDNVTIIGEYAFAGCANLTSIRVPDGVTHVGQYAFAGCGNLASFRLPDGVTEIDFGVFQSCASLTSIDIPDGVTRIGSFAFQNCTGLASIRIPDGVTEILISAFEGCENLTSITLPDSITDIEWHAFFGCPNLTICGAPGSYAEQYARKNHIPFNPSEPPASRSDLIKLQQNRLKRCRPPY